MTGAPQAGVAYRNAPQYNTAKQAGPKQGATVPALQCTMDASGILWIEAATGIVPAVKMYALTLMVILIGVCMQGGGCLR